jgi:PAS domain S-box-containing protein
LVKSICKPESLVENQTKTRFEVPVERGYGMDKTPRVSGFRVIGDIAWGTHFCQFYQTQEELMDILFPYLKTGLENNELCIWALPQVFETNKEAAEFLKKTIPELEIYREKGQIEIIPYKAWYAEENRSGSKKAIKSWIEKADQALDNGYDGLRLVQDRSGLKNDWLKNDWKNLINYEEELDGAIENRRIIALCTYSSGNFGTNETIHMALNHRFVLIKREEKWEKVENFRLKRAEERVVRAAREVKTKSKEENENLEKLLEERTVQLEKAYESLKESEKCLSQAQKMAHVGNWKWDIVTGELHWSDEVYRIFGRDPERFKATYDSFLSSVHPDDRKYLVNAIKKSCNGELQNIDYRLIRPDGEERIVHGQAEIIFDEKNIPVRAEGIVQDVTELKRTEEALQESEEQYRAFFENSIDAVLFTSPDGTIHAANPAACKIFGMTEEEITRGGRNGVVDVSDPELRAGLEERARTGKFRGELNCRRKDGTIFPGEVSSAFFRDKNELVKTVMIIRDITASKQIEEALRKSEEHYRMLFTNMSEALFLGEIIYDSGGKPHDYRFLDINPAFELHTGIKKEQVLGKSHLEVFHEANPMVLDKYVEVALSGKPAHFEFFTHLTGKYIDIYVFSPEKGKFAAIFRDITERKKMEKALKKANETLEEKVKERTAELEKAYNSLKESEASLAEAQKMSHIGNWDWDLVTKELYTSDEMCRIFGLNPQEFDASFEAFLNYVHPADQDFITTAYRDVLNGKELVGTDYRIIRADGEERVVHGQGKVIRNNENIPVRIRGTAQDITERKRTEKALELSEERYRIIAEQTGQLIYDYNVEKDTADLAGNVKEITGYIPEAYNNLNLDFLLSRIHPEDLKMFLETRERFLTCGGIYRTEYRFRKENGDYSNIEDNGVGLKDDRGKVKRIIGVINDITERKKAEDTIANIEAVRKKEIHHRIKNNLQVISSLLDLQAEKFKSREHVENSEVLDAFRESQDRVISISLIHEELHEGKGTNELNISPYLKKLVENLFQTYSLGNLDLSLDMDLEENIFFDIDVAVPLGLIVNEIVSNSLKYAFPNGKGIIRINLCREENGEFARKVPGNKKGESKNEVTNFRITVSDNGTGLPENLNVESSETLGLQLISILIDQLDGKLELKRNSGTEYIIRFAVTEKK